MRPLPSYRTLAGLVIILALASRLASAQENGTYRIETVGNTALWYENGDKLVVTSSPPDDDSTRFILESQSDGSFRIKNKASGLYLHEDGKGDKRLSTRYQPGDDFTKFIFELQKDNSYRIKVKANDRYLRDDGKAAGGPVTTSTQTDDNHSRFLLLDAKCRPHDDVKVTLDNQRTSDVELFRITRNGDEDSHGTISAGKAEVKELPVGFRFLVREVGTKKELVRFLSTTTDGFTVPVKAVTGPVPVDASAADRLPSIMSHASADDSLDVAWVRSDGAIMVSSYSASNFAASRHIQVKGALANLAGFTKDGANVPNFYVLTTAQEQQSARLGLRPGIVNLLRITGDAKETLLADLNSEKFLRGTDPAANSIEAIVNPLFDLQNNRGTGRLIYSDGGGGGFAGPMLVPMLTHNWWGRDGIYHQRAVLKMLTHGGHNAYEGGGYWGHCADLRLLADDNEVIVAHASEEGLGLSKLLRGEFILPTWWGVKRLAAAPNGHKSRIRLGGIAKTGSGTGSGYLVAYTYGADGFMWDPKDREQPSKDDVFVVPVARDFVKEAITPVDKFMDSQAVATDVVSRRLTTYTTTGDATARRLCLVNLSGGRHLLVWERWSVKDFRGDIVVPNWGAFESTWAMIVDDKGDQVVAPKSLGPIRIQKESDAFFLPVSKRAGWVCGDAENGQMLLHTVDDSLNVKTIALSTKQ